MHGLFSFASHSGCARVCGGPSQRMEDRAGRLASSLAKDDKTRASFDTIWENAASGNFEALQRSIRRGGAAARDSVSPSDTPANLLASALVHPTVYEHVLDRTRVLYRTAIHAAITGCASKVTEVVQAAALQAASSSITAPTKTARRTAAGTQAASGLGLDFKRQRAGDLQLADLMPKKTVKGTWREKDRAIVTKIQGLQDLFGRVITLLVGSGLDVNAGDVDACTPLMLAARFGLVRCP